MRIHWLFYLSLAFLPFSFGLINFEVGIVTLNPYIVGMCTIVLLGSLRWLMRMQTSFVGLYDVFVFLLAATYLVSTFLADDIIDAGFLAFHALFIPIVSYFAARIALQTDKQYVLSLKFFVISVFLFSVYFIGEYFLLESRTKVLGIPPIGAATLAVSALVIAFNMKDSRLMRWSGFIILCALILTFSRAYMLTLLIAPIFWKLVRRGYTVFMVVAFILSTLLLTLVVSHEPEVFMPTHYDKSVEFSADRLANIDFLLGSIYGRAVSYKEGIDRFLESPIFGSGLSSGEYMVTLHNFHIEWLQYGGIIGYFLYAAVFISHAIRMRRPAENDHWVAANVVAIFMILANSVTNGLMHGVMPYMIFILMGLNEARLFIDAKGADTSEGKNSTEDIVKANFEPTRILRYARKGVSEHDNNEK